jgi:methylenetetrahydrofolate reductase (NADPH)
MARILPFLRNPARTSGHAGLAPRLTQDFSLEVMPRTAAKVASFREILPEGTRVYLAHIDGVAFDEMLATARRLADEGFRVVPHFPARGIADAGELAYRIAAYADLGISRALVLAGGITTPRGSFSDSMQLLETGLFDAHGYGELFVAGHPEGNRDIDADGGTARVMASLAWKNAFQSRTDARMAIVTQFCFESAPVVAWAESLRSAGITLPIHLGVAGPARLQTMIKFAMACGVGASLRVLQRRAADLSKLMLPYEPDEMLAELAAAIEERPALGIERVHFFPLGGITATTDYLDRHETARARKQA